MMSELDFGGSSHEAWCSIFFYIKVQVDMI